MNQQGNIPELTPPSLDLLPRRLYVWNLNWFYSPYHPADYLANKILSSKQFNEAKICKAALLVKEQAEMYEKIHKKYGSNTNPLDERVVWDDNGIDEAFFCKNY